MSTVLDRSELGAEPARRPSPDRQRARRRRLPPPAHGGADRRDRRPPVRRRAVPPRPPRPRPTRPSARRGRGGRRRAEAAEDDDDGAPPPPPRAAAAAAAAERAQRGGRDRRGRRRASATRRRARGRQGSSRASSSCSRNGSGFVRLTPPEPVRRRRLHLGRAGQPLRARLRRPRRRPGARPAPLRALPVADPRRHDQRPPGRRGRRGHALRRPAGGVPDRALRARLRRRDGQGDRVADAVRQGLARRRSPAPARAGKTEALRRLAGALAGHEGIEVSRRARRRPARGDRRVARGPGRAGAPR